MALPFEMVVGLRYLRAKRRTRTISLNTLVSIAGITLGVAALMLIQNFLTLDASVYMISKIPVHIQMTDVLLVASSAILINFAATVYPSL